MLSCFRAFRVEADEDLTRWSTKDNNCTISARHTHTHSIRIVTNQKSVPIFAFFLATKAFTSSTWSCPSFLSTSKRTSNHYDKKLKFPFFRTSHGALHLIQHLQLTQQFAIMEKRQNYNYSKAISFFRTLLSKVFLFL